MEKHSIYTIKQPMAILIKRKLVMKEEYIPAELDIIRFDTNDIITSSVDENEGEPFPVP